MVKVIRVALPTYNALTETDPDNFALISDDDWILIKEKARGSISVSNGDSEPIAHGLAYVPFVVVFYEVSLGVWRKLIGDDEFNANDVYMGINATNLILYNYSGASVDFKYYIFYDQIV